ncbi:hypothetical protein BN946_scf184945.g4 [Trametes cinnabarina]|uniref:Uncharacterized protein n=1 Tax=Pycnoporus cinnabarinus TaxID=5643 RepID=A0A060SK96_PYCCI|nr:hypothetical protein BN946_scf184945.g4 [Trametes cinnabarina]
MQVKSLIAVASIVLATVLGVSAEEQKQEAHETTIWVPKATVVETNTYTATRIDQIWTTTPPYEWETTYPITWTAVETKTSFVPVVTTVPQRRHARDFEAA